MAVETRDITLIKVGFSHDPVLRLFSIQETTLIKVTLLTMSRAMSRDDAEELEQKIHTSFECIDSGTGKFFIQDGFSELHPLDQLQDIIDVIGESTEVMKTTKDYPENFYKHYKQHAELLSKQTIHSKLQTMPRFISTGNDAADDLMMKIRNGHKESYKL